MSAQTAYTINSRTALPGMVADLHDNEIRSAQAGGEIPFGHVVGLTETAAGAVIAGTPDSVGDYRGIAVRTQEQAAVAPGTERVGYADKDSVAYISAGFVYLVFTNSASIGNPVSYTQATGVPKAGAASGATEAAIDGAICESSGAAGEPILVRLTDERTATAGT